MSDSLFRAIFYQKNPAAARTKFAAGAHPSSLSDSFPASDRRGPQFPTSGWSSRTDDLPKVTVATVVGHLVKTGKAVPNVQGEDEITVVQKPLERGHAFFFDGYVHDVAVHGDKEHVFAKSKCWASQRKAVKYHQQVVFTPADEDSDDGVYVSFATCHGCPAGENGGLCQHIFALLIVINHYYPREESGSLPGPSSATSNPCTWGPRKRNVKPQAVMQSTIEKAKTDDERKRSAVSCSLCEARGPSVRSVTQADIEKLRSSLPDVTRMKRLLPSSFAVTQTAYGPVPCGSVLSYQLRKTPPKRQTMSTAQAVTEGQPEVTKLPQVFPCLPFVAAKDHGVEDEVEWHIDLGSAQEVERRTRGQARNADWQNLHNHVITSSNFKKVIRGKQASDSILSALFEGKDLSTVPAIQHGREFEQVAVDSYVSLKATDGTPVEVKECGIALHTTYRYLGASPDRVVFDRREKPRFGLLEVKCPFSAYRDGLTVEQASQRADFCCTLVDGQVKLKKDHAYYYQVQGQLAITGARWCDFFIWIGTSVHLERVYADEQFWKEALPPLLMFYRTAAIPFLRGRGRPVPDPPSLQVAVEAASHI